MSWVASIDPMDGGLATRFDRLRLGWSTLVVDRQERLSRRVPCQELKCKGPELLNFPGGDDWMNVVPNGGPKLLLAQPTRVELEVQAGRVAWNAKAHPVLAVLCVPAQRLVNLCLHDWAACTGVLRSASQPARFRA